MGDQRLHRWTKHCYGVAAKLTAGWRGYIRTASIPATTDCYEVLRGVTHGVLRDPVIRSATWCYIVTEKGGYTREYVMLRGDSADMMCHACRGVLKVGEEYLQCMVTTCGLLYHYLCYNKELTFEEKAAWVCPECCNARKRGGRNCDTPVGTPVSIKNVASRKQSESSIPASEPATDLSIAQELQLTRNQMTVLTGQLANATAAIAQYQELLTESVKKFNLISERLLKLESVPVCPCKCGESGPGPSPSGIVITAPKPKPRRKRRAKGNSSSEMSALAGNVGRTSSEEELNASRGEPTASSGEVGSEQAENVNDGEEAEAEGYKEVRYRKRRFTSVRGTAGPDLNPLKAVEQRRFIHLWNMVSGADDVRRYLQTLNPECTYTVEELKPKGEYKSFKIGVPAKMYEMCLTASIWPDNARVKAWLFRGYQYSGKSA